MSSPVELAAIDRGAGEPVLLVHGGVYHAAPAWARQLGPLIESGYRVIAVDRRGHGRSPEGDEEFVPVSLQAEDLAKTLDAREIGSAHFVGVSYGCLVILEFALMAPERTLSMTLHEPPVFTWLENDPEYGVWFSKFEEIAERRKTEPLERWLPEWAGLMDKGMSRVNTESPQWKIIQRQAPLIFKEEAGWQYRPDEKSLEALAVPALVTSGDQSEPPMSVVAQMLTDKLPKATHKWIPGAGHDAHARRPEIFNLILLGYLASVGGKQEV